MVPWFHGSMANHQDEIDSLTYQLAAKEKTVERLGRRIDEIAMDIAEIKISQARAEERDKRIESMLSMLLSKA